MFLRVPKDVGPTPHNSWSSPVNTDVYSEKKIYQGKRDYKKKGKKRCKTRLQKQHRLERKPQIKSTVT